MIFSFSKGKGNQSGNQSCHVQMFCTLFLRKKEYDVNVRWVDTLHNIDAETKRDVEGSRYPFHVIFERKPFNFSFHFPLHTNQLFKRLIDYRFLGGK